MWKKIYDALGKGTIVAKYQNKMGIEVLQVREMKNSYVTLPNFQFISRYTVNKDEVIRKSKETSKDSPDEIAKKRLDSVCELIEKNYATQSGVIVMNFL